MNREVIVKQVECNSQECASSAMEEGRIAKVYRHPYICECLDFVKERKSGGESFVYIISPKMPKSFEQEIQDRIRTHRYFTEKDLWKFAKQLISAYAFLQDKVTFIQNIAHRDIKPQNILLDEKGNVKVCDFGFAKVVDLGGPAMHTLLGTIPYFSPALRRALISGERDITMVEHNVFKSDVYSLGICLAYATILEIPTFITSLSNLQNNILARMDMIKMYTRDWVNLLEKMLMVNEAMRPDFIKLERSLKNPFLFDDDEIIQDHVIEAEQQDPLQISVKCGLIHVRVSPSLSEEVPCMISLKALEVDPNLASFFNDIVAVIDEGSSMGRYHIGMVQQSLVRLIEKLRARDRMCIVTFSHKAKRKCPLTCCSPAGKETLRKIVNELNSKARTNISAGFVMGLEVLEQRRMKNAGASILLFSDGKDSTGLDPLPICLEKYRSLTDSKITVHVFGYDTELDARLLDVLAREGNGYLHHITEISQIQAAIALAYRHLTSVIARNLRVTVAVIPGRVKCSIPKIYTKDDAQYFFFPDAIANQERNLIFMLKAEHQILAKATNFEPVTVLAEYEDNEGTEYHRSAKMSVTFVPWRDASPYQDSDVFANWERMKVADCLRVVRLLANSKDFSKANEILRDGINSLESSRFQTHELIVDLGRDLNQAKEFVECDEIWQRGGEVRFDSMLTMLYSSAQQIHFVEEIEQCQFQEFPRNRTRYTCKVKF